MAIAPQAPEIFKVFLEGFIVAAQKSTATVKFTRAANKVLLANDVDGVVKYVSQSGGANSKLRRILDAHCFLRSNLVLFTLERLLTDLLFHCLDDRRLVELPGDGPLG